MFKQIVISFLFLTCIYSQDKTPVKKTEIVEDTRTVIANGVGANRDQAVEDGLRNAVEQAIGVYLKSTTIVENYQAIDKLLTHSRGYVKNYDIILEKTEPPLYRVKISAVVIVRELKTSLIGLDLYKQQIEGKNMFAAAMTKVNATQQGLKLLEDLFEEYPRNGFVLEFGEPTIKTSSTDILEVRIQVTVKWNMNFIADLEEILEEVAFDFKEFNTYYGGAVKQWSKQFSGPPNENTVFQLHTKLYALNPDISKYLSGTFSRNIYCWIHLNNVRGEQIKSKRLDIRKNSNFPYYLGKGIGKTKEIAPASKQIRKFTVLFKLTLEEMNQVVDISGYATK